MSSHAVSAPDSSCTCSTTAMPIQLLAIETIVPSWLKMKRRWRVWPLERRRATSSLRHRGRLPRDGLAPFLGGGPLGPLRNTPAGPPGTNGKATAEKTQGKEIDSLINDGIKCLTPDKKQRDRGTYVARPYPVRPFLALSRPCGSLGELSSNHRVSGSCAGGKSNGGRV